MEQTSGSRRQRLVDWLRARAGWLGERIRRLQPAERARRGAARGALAMLLAYGVVMGGLLRTPFGRLVDFAIGALLAWLASRLALLALRLTWRLLPALAGFIGWAGLGALAALVFFFVTSLFPPPLGLGVAAAMVAAGAGLGGAVARLSGGAGDRRSRLAAIAVATVSAAALTAGVLWLRWDGTDEHLIAVDGAWDGAVTALTLPDPGQPGPLAVHTTVYGSGTDRRRPEFGAGVPIVTPTVDASAFTKGYKGFRARGRDRYWGFGPDAYPLNGRVWYPEGDGPFPLVLIVHGNHGMGEFSDPGYAYLGEHLASRGMILVSVDENFLNGSILGGVPRENDARGWLLLEHLALWRGWQGEAGHPFAGKVDLERIALIGHSRGGEAAAIAASFNRLRHYPDDATVDFDFGFAIRAVVAIAPSDGQYRPADKRTPLTDVSYLTLQGGHDSDVSAFLGDRQYDRLRLTGACDCFKASLYAYRANHGQFNTVWGRSDYSPPHRWLLNLKPLIDGAAQRKIATTAIGAFLETTLFGRDGYRALFRDHRAGRAWLPEDLYVTRYEDLGFRVVADFEEDIDVTTTTLEGGALAAEGLALWREDDVELRQGGRRENGGVYLGWRLAEAGAPPPRYTVTLPPGLAAAWGLDGASRLVFQLAAADESVPEPDDQDDENGENGEHDEHDEHGENGEHGEHGENGEPEAADDQRDDRDDDGDQGDPEPLMLSVELVAGEVAVRLPLAGFRTLLPPLPMRFTKLDLLEGDRYGTEAEPVLQTFELPLAAFAAAEPAFDPAALSAIRLVFDGDREGVVILDRLGFAADRGAAGAGSRLAAAEPVR